MVFLRPLMALTIAYLAQGKLRLKIGAEEPRTLESGYAETLRQRAARASQRHSWKSEGGGFLSGAVLWGNSGAAQGPTPIFITSVSGGSNPGQVVYSLENGGACALLAAENFGADERRLWNNNTFQVQHVSACPRTGSLAFSVAHKNGSANIGIMLKDESGVKEVTEGDSVDTAPRWLAGEGRKLVFQSAGIGRDRHGSFLALGPFTIMRLDLDSAEMETLVEDPDYDFVSPQLMADGTLYFIRRPYHEYEGISPFRFIKDVVLFPFRLLRALFHFLNFFSMAYSGKKLTTSGGVRTRDMDVKQMKIWGNLVRAQAASDGNEAPDLVPSSWQLIRRRGRNQEQVLAKGVLAYDIAADGTVVYSNGNAIFSLAPDGKKQGLVSERMIEQVVVVGS